MSSVPPRPGNMVVPASVSGNQGYPGGFPSNAPAGPGVGFGARSGPNMAPQGGSTKSEGGGGFFEVDLGGDQGGSDFFEQSGYAGHAAHPGGGVNAMGAGAPHGSSQYTGGAPVSAFGGASAPYGGLHAPSGGMWGANNASGIAAERPTPAAHQQQYAPQPQAQGQTQQQQAQSNAPPASSKGFFGFNSTGSGTSPPPPTQSAGATPAPATQVPKAGTTSSAPPASSRPGAAPTSTAGGESGKGLFGNFQKSLLKYMYPDAHDASENIGKSLEAVYNKETGRWEFPGEVRKLQL
jgi:hypothetical protein